MSDSMVAIVTGAGRGIGAETAILLAKHGYKVCVNYHHSVAQAQTVVTKIQEFGGRAIAVQADVASETEVQSLFSIVDKELGTITALVNNAGILFPQCGFLDIDAARFEKVLRTNLMGSFYCCQAALVRMAISNGGNGGSIVNVSSLASKTGSPYEYIDYAASKGAIDSMTFGLAREFAHESVRVNAVRPGLIDTDIHASGGEKDRIKRLSSRIPMQRGGQAKEVAEAIYWLLSEQSSFTTGALIDVAGGL